MSTGTDEGAFGKIMLYDKFYESMDRQVEKSISAILIATDNSTLTLELRNGSFRQSSKSRKKDTDVQYKISVKKLIELVQKNGEKL